MSIARVVGTEPVLTRKGLDVRNLAPAQAVLLLIAIGSLVRILLAFSFGLGIDESYMVGVSRQLAWSYFDHPPLHIWLVGLWAKLFGESPLVLRLPFIALFAGSTWLMYRLTVLAYGERAGLWATLAFNLAPVFTFSTASWVLPDGPMVFFMLLAAYCAASVLLVDRPPRESMQLWLGAGIAGGLAMLSKYLAVFLFVGIGLYLLTSWTQRRWLARSEPWLGILIAVLLFTPVLVWNAAHDFSSFAFQGQRGIPSSFDPNEYLQDIGGQLVYLLPWIAIPLGLAIFRSIGAASESDRLFAWLAAPASVIFLVLGLGTRVLPHWPMAGWLFGFPLLGHALSQIEQLHGRALRRTAAATAAFLLGFLALSASQANTGWIDRIAPTLMAHDPTIDLLDWRALDPQLASRGLIMPGGFVGTAHWIEAGSVNYALGGRVPVLCLCDDARQFAFLHDERHYWGRDAVLLSQNVVAIKALSARFESVEMLPDIVLLRGGRAAVTLKVARAIGFKSRQ